MERKKRMQENDQYQPEEKKVEQDDKIGKLAKKIGTVTVIAASFFFGYLLVLIFTLLGEDNDLIFFSQPYVYYKLIIISVFNLLIPPIGGIFLVFQLIKEERRAQTNKIPWLLGFFNLTYLFIFSFSSILCLKGIITLTGGMFFSPFTGFYSMLLSILMVCLYKWTESEATIIDLLKPALAVSLFFVVTSFSIYHSCGRDSLELTFEYPISFIDPPQMEKILNNLDEFERESGVEISYYQDIGFFEDLGIFRGEELIALGAEYSDPNLYSKMDQLFDELDRICTKEGKDNEDTWSLKNALNELSTQFKKMKKPTHNKELRLFRAHVIVSGIFFALLIAFSEKWGILKKKKEQS